MSLPSKSPVSVYREVQRRIDEHRVTMHTKTYFVMRATLGIVLAIALFCTSLFLVSFILFLLQSQNLLHVPSTGSTSFYLFIYFFPWIPAVVVVILATIVMYILKRYSFMYARPVVVWAAALTIIAFAISSLLQLMSFHSRFSTYAIARKIPLFGSFYQSYHTIHAETAFNGIVLTNDGGVLYVMTTHNEMVQLRIVASTTISNTIHSGDSITAVAHANTGIGWTADYIRDNGAAQQ